jgi:GNAT superfamily N-acetyltransferase
MEASMSPKISIRRAEANDRFETAALFSETFRSMDFIPKLHSDEEDREFVEDFIAGGDTWIAILNGRIAGLACLEGGWLSHLYVHPAAQNQGVGTALLAYVKAQRPKGFQLWTFQANTGARRFYERHGCTAAEFTDGQRNEEKQPDVRYVWAAPDAKP